MGEPMSMYIKMDDPDLPAFYYDPLIHPIPYYSKTEESFASIEDETNINNSKSIRSLNISPFFDNEPVYTINTSSALALIWAPRPFHLRSGNTRRAYDIPLANQWYFERLPAGLPVKIRVSSQKLMKNYVLNAIHK